MYSSKTCPSCNRPIESNASRYPAIVAPFISEYVLNQKPIVTELIECLSCGMRFFFERYTPKEIQKLYSNYRDEKYFESRHRHERWYSLDINNSIGQSPDEIERRKSRVEQFVQKTLGDLEVSKIETVLD